MKKASDTQLSVISHKLLSDAITALRENMDDVRMCFSSRGGETGGRERGERGEAEGAGRKRAGREGAKEVNNLPIVICNNYLTVYH